MKIILFEDDKVLALEPIVLSRPVFDIRYGSGTLYSRLEQFYVFETISFWVRESIKKLTSELYPKHSVNRLHKGNIIWLNARVLWNKSIIEKINSEPSKKFCDGDNLLAANLNYKESVDWLSSRFKKYKN